MNSVSIGKKNRIVIRIGQDSSGKYIANSNDGIDRIGDKRGRAVHWELQNPLTHDVVVTIGNFNPSCPIKGGHFEKEKCTATRTVRHGDRERVTGVIDKKASGTGFTYEVHVSGPNGANPVDPELQIDDDGPVRGKVLIAIAVVVLLLGALLYFFRS